jgi:hypothetical protein
LILVTEHQNSPSNAHAYRLLIFKELQAPAAFATLHLLLTRHQHRSEIMSDNVNVVNPYSLLSLHNLVAKVRNRCKHCAQRLHLSAEIETPGRLTGRLHVLA